MSVVESLLQLVESQDADALFVTATDPPRLERRGAVRPLSMPPLGADLCRSVLDEVLEPERAEALARGERVETEHAAKNGIRWVVGIEPRPEGPALVFRRGVVAKPAAAPAAAPSRPRPTPAPATTAPVAPPSTMPRPEPAPPVAASVYAPVGPVAIGGSIGAAIEHALGADASDVVLSSGHPPWIRSGGEMSESGGPPIEPEEIEAFLSPWLDQAAAARLHAQGAVDLAIELEIGGRPRRWRANAFHQSGGLAVALRAIRERPPTLSALGLPADFAELARYRMGLVLVAGTAGSGKSTTLAALVDHLNGSASKHVITLEDPIEHVHPPQRSLIHQREVGRDVPDFATGLRAALRESPDVILLGEMRDVETVRAALTAAETGHLVLGTIHSGTAATAVDRLIDLHPSHEHGQVRAQLAQVLRAVLVQMLLPSTTPPRRVLAYEKLVVTTAVAAKLREGRAHQLGTEIQKGRSEGMVALEASLAELVRGGRLARGLAERIAPDRKLFDDLVRSGA